MLVGLSIAQAADSTLACQGTATAGTEDAKPEPISMGIIVTRRHLMRAAGAGLALTGSGLISVLKLTFHLDHLAGLITPV
jgi:hypothetical protein